MALIVHRSLIKYQVLHIVIGYLAISFLLGGCASAPTRQEFDKKITSKREILSLPGYCYKALGFGEKPKGSGKYRLIEIVYLCSSGSPTINNGDKLQVILPDGRGGYETDSTGKPVIHDAIKLPDRIELTH